MRLLNGCDEVLRIDNVWDALYCIVFQGLWVYENSIILFEVISNKISVSQRPSTDIFDCLNDESRLPWVQLFEFVLYLSLQLTHLHVSFNLC